MKATVVNFYRDEFDVYCGRKRRDYTGPGADGYFSNPIPLKNFKDEVERKMVQARFEQLFNARINTDPEYKKRVLELRGKRLACFCVPYHEWCHVMTIANFVNRYFGDE